MTAFATINYDKPANELSNDTGKPLLAGVAGCAHSGPSGRGGRSGDRER